MKKINEYDLIKTKMNAQSVIIAVEKYYTDNNKYPENLNVLVPKYISTIPKTCTYNSFDRDFNYIIGDDGVFQLTIYMNSRCPYFYNAKDKRWYPHPKG